MLDLTKAVQTRSGFNATILCSRVRLSYDRDDSMIVLIWRKSVAGASLETRHTDGTSYIDADDDLVNVPMYSLHSIDPELVRMQTKHWEELMYQNARAFADAFTIETCRQIRAAFERLRERNEAPGQKGKTACDLPGTQGEELIVTEENKTMFEPQLPMCPCCGNCQGCDCYSTQSPQFREIETLRQWLCDLQSGMYVNCVYCGHRYGPDPGTPVAMAEVLKEHIKICPKHPCSEQAKRIGELEETLVICNKQLARLRKIAANIPGAGYIKAKEAAGSPDVLHPTERLGKKP